MAQRQGIKDAREGELAESRTLALMAASGGGGIETAGGAGIVGGINEQKYMNYMTSIWNGENRAQGLIYQGKVARAEGRHRRTLDALARKPILILDDWGLTGFTEELRRDLLELVEERHNRHSLVITSQFPVDTWHELLGDPTLADAILDRIVHRAYQINLKGESMRKSGPGSQEDGHDDA